MSSARLALLRLQAPSSRGTDADLAETLAQVSAQIDGALALVDYLQDWERLRQSAPQVRRRRIRLAPLVEESVARHASAAQLRAMPLHFVVEREVVWSVDPDLWARVLDNLLGNSVRHGKAGEPVRISADDRTLRVVNALPAAARAGVAGLDRRRDRARSRGEGLGLDLCRDIVAAHGGTLQLLWGDDQTLTVELSMPPAATDLLLVSAGEALEHSFAAMVKDVAGLRVSITRLPDLANAAEGLDLFFLQTPALVVVDGRDDWPAALELLRTLRERPDAGVSMLVVLGSERDAHGQQWCRREAVMAGADEAHFRVIEQADLLRLLGEAGNL